MKRRNALRSLAFTIGGTLTLPAWANGWHPDRLPASALSLTTGQQALLAEVVETMIPTTDTPGAKELGVHEFIRVMVADCYDRPAQETFRLGLERLPEQTRRQMGKGFLDCTAAQRTAMLQNLDAAHTKTPGGKNDFYPFLKRLTIQGYLNSEYVMVNLLKYELIPSRFDGAFPVKSLTKAPQK